MIHRDTLRETTRHNQKRKACGLEAVVPPVPEYYFSARSTPRWEVKIERYRQTRPVQNQENGFQQITAGLDASLMTFREISAKTFIEVG